MEIVHVISDEKFINSAYWQFEKVFPNRNTFFLIASNINSPLRHVDLKPNIVIVDDRVDTLKLLYKRFKNTKIVCFHGLDYYRSVVMNHTPDQYKKIWVLWGVEFYGNPKLYDINQSIGKQTFEVFYKKSFLKKIDVFFRKVFRGLYYNLKYNTLSPNLEIKNAIKNSDYLAVLYEEEFYKMKDSAMLKAEYIKFSYYPIERMVASIDEFVTGNDLLIGNSASITNNHLEIFNVLKEIDLNEIKVVVPLSYGNENYKKAIIDYGVKYLKNNFEPIVDFMPLHQYNNYLRKCGIVIMNHYRQQAVGNVLTMLWMGAKVYLDSRNTLYHYLKRIGISVYTVDNFIADNESRFQLLQKDEQLKNREILKREVGEKVLLYSIKTHLSKLL